MNSQLIKSGFTHSPEVLIHNISETKLKNRLVVLLEWDVCS